MPVITNVAPFSPSTEPDSQPSWIDIDKVLAEVKQMKVESDEKDRGLAELEAALKAKD